MKSSASRQFELMGFDCPVGLVPGPVSPIGRLDGKLVTAFAAGQRAITEELPVDSSYETLSQRDLCRIGAFDPSSQQLFALTPSRVVAYSSGNERRFFVSLLQDGDWAEKAPFARLAMAWAAGDLDLIRREISRCGKAFSSAEARERWYRAITSRPNPLASALPKAWDEFEASSSPSGRSAGWSPPRLPHNRSCEDRELALVRLRAQLRRQPPGAIERWLDFAVHGPRPISLSDGDGFPLMPWPDGYRAALFDQLDYVLSRDHHPVLLLGPAGSGKSTLLRAWGQRRKRPVTWLDAQRSQLRYAEPERITETLISASFRDEPDGFPRWCSDSKAGHEAIAELRAGFRASDSFEDLRPLERASLVLSFKRDLALSSNCPLPVVCLDNVDSLDTQTASSVIRALYRVTRWARVPFIVALRSRTAIRVRSATDAVVYDVIWLPLMRSSQLLANVLLSGGGAEIARHVGWTESALDLLRAGLGALLAPDSRSASLIDLASRGSLRSAARLVEVWLLGVASNHHETSGLPGEGWAYRELAHAALQTGLVPNVIDLQGVPSKERDGNGLLAPLRVLRLVASSGAAGLDINFAKDALAAMGLPRSVIDATLWKFTASSESGPVPWYREASKLFAGDDLASVFDHWLHDPFYLATCTSEGLDARAPFFSGLRYLLGEIYAEDRRQVERLTARHGSTAYIEMYGLRLESRRIFERLSSAVGNVSRSLAPIGEAADRYARMARDVELVLGLDG